MVKLRCETKITGTNYRTVSQDVQLLIDESFAEKIIPANDSVRLLDEIVEEMDLTLLMRAYNARGRKPAASPSTMLKILLYANMEGIYSSRKIATACVRDLNFIWLRNGEKSPGYHEIARFRSKRLPECAEALFVQLVKKLHEIGEIKFDHLFVDGLKLRQMPTNTASFGRKAPTNMKAGCLPDWRSCRRSFAKNTEFCKGTTCFLRWKRKCRRPLFMVVVIEGANCSEILRLFGGWKPKRRNMPRIRTPSAAATAFPKQTRMPPLCT